MKEIKFRAWQKTHGYMTDDIAMSGGVFYYDDPQDGIRIDDDWALMQYTGLKDKNGKEIYEGDILRPSKYSGITSYNFPVIFKDGGFMLSGKLSGFRRLIESLHHSRKAGNEYEVIGNIYENRNLLD